MADQRTPGVGGGGGGQQGEEGVNVQVLLRCRPLSDKEIAERAPQVVTVNEATREVMLFQNTAGKASSRTFRFDKVFNSDSTQEKLFKQAIVPIVNEVMDGFNCTIFAYGQTGTGKTYTMEGGPRESDDGKKLSAQAGVIPRSIKQIFDTIEANNSDSTVKVSFLELYNEELTDLMSFDDDTKKLRLLEDRSGVVVQGLEEVIVRNATEIYQVLDRGTAKRRTAATLLNQRSSRSHSIFCITIHMKETTPEGEDVIKIGKLNLVDLAGSENISRSGAKDNRAREAGSINQSLLTLGRVITALVEHSGHIPYRDSKLTRLLRDSLGGRTKTCIIATIAPTVHCQDETISTLDYAHRAKNIRNRPELNQKISKTTMIKELAAEIERLKLDLQCNREKTGVYLSNERYEAGELERVQLRESLKATRAELEANEATHVTATETLQAQHNAQVAQLQALVAKRDAQLSAKEEELGRAHVALQERAFVTASLRRAEQSLAGFAEQLTQELGLCNQDINNLAERLQQGCALQAADRACLQHVQASVSARTQQLGSALAAALSGQSSHLVAISEDLAAFKDQRGKEVSALRQQLGSIQQAVTALKATCEQQMQALASCATGCLTQAGTKASETGSAASAAADKAAQAADAAVGSLLEVLSSQAQVLERLVAANQQETAAAVSMITEYHKTAEDGLQDVVSKVHQVAQHDQEGVQQVQALMNNFAAQFTQGMQKQQEALLHQVGQLLGSFTQQHTQALGVGMTSLQQALTQHSTQTQQQADKLGAGASGALTKLQAMHPSLASKLVAAQCSLQSGAVSSHDAIKTAHTAGGAARDQHAALAGATTRCISEQTKSLEQLLGAGQQQYSSCSSTASEQLGGACVVLAGMSGHVLSAINTQHEEAMVFAGALSRQAEDAGVALQGLGTPLVQGHAAAVPAGLGASQQQGLKQLGSEVDERVVGALRVQQPPAPPARARPATPGLSAIQELMCPDEEVLLSHLRKMAKKGGDAQSATAMLLSPMLPNTMMMTSPRPNRAAPMPMSPGSAQQAPGSISLRSSADNTASGGHAPASDAQQTRSSKIPGFANTVGLSKQVEAGSPLKAAGGIRAAGMLVDRTNV